jgi:hypothetical protein
VSGGADGVLDILPHAAAEPRARGLRQRLSAAAIPARLVSLGVCLRVQSEIGRGLLRLYGDGCQGMWPQSAGGGSRTAAASSGKSLYLRPFASSRSISPTGTVGRHIVLRVCIAGYTGQTLGH